MKTITQAICLTLFALFAMTAKVAAVVPLIVTQPVNQTNSEGGTVSFSVTATSASPLTYQWSFNSTNLPDATNALLTLTNVQPAQVGSYAVAVGNDDGTTNSAAATLTVYLTPNSLFFDDFSGPELNPVWQATLPDAYSGSFPYGSSQSALYIGAPSFGFQTLAGSSVLRLTNSLSPLQRCGWSTITNFATGEFRYEARFNSLTQSISNSIDGFIEIWIINATNSSLYDIVSPFGGGYDSSLSFFAGSTVDNSFSETSFNYTNNTWYRIVLAGGPGQNIRASILSDGGTELIGQTLNHDPTAFGSGFQIALSQLVGSSQGTYPVDVAVDYVNLADASAPLITSQPAGQTLATGGTASFSTSARGTAPLTYQWSFNGSPLAGATNTTLVLTNVQPTQAGTYSVEVVNAYGAAFSTNATLNTGGAPVINTQPASQAVALGGTATFTAAATGTAPFSWQWKFNGTNLLNATNASLTLTNVQLSKAGIYSARVANLFGSATSSNAVLTVQAAPLIVAQPTNRTVLAGSAVTLAASATGTAPLVYLWSVNGTNLTGATNTTLVLTNVQPSQAGLYALSVTNAFGGIVSSNAILTVNGLRPVFTNQPASQSVVYGNTASFSVTVGGTAPFAYQWTFNGTNIASATNSSLILAGVQYAQAGNYAVVVTSPYGTNTSANGVLTVLSPLATAFFDDFTGTNLNANWQTNLPISAHSGSFPYGSSQTAAYLGGGNFAFQSLNSNSVLRLTNHLANLQRRGWDSVTNYGGTNFYFEARYNSMNQSITSSIDGFVELWIIDAANSNRYDIVSPFGGGYATSPSFFSGSSIDNSYSETSLTYSNNTWYHLVLQSAPGQNIRASILNDAGTELIGRTFSHSASAYPSGFKIGLSQSVGNSGGTYPVDVAVDYVRLTVSYPPVILAQPVPQTVAPGATASFNVGVAGLAPIYYQWSFNGTNLSGATNATLTLTNVQLVNAGNYSVAITNSAGGTNSAPAALTVISPLVITQQPQSQTVPSYGSASFTVAATGTGSIAYQWRKNGTNLVDGGNLSGSTTTNLTLSTVSLADAGNYDVVITNLYSATNSAVAVLTVPQTGLSLGSTNAMSGGTIAVPVWMNALGNENTFLASVGYDPTKLVLQSIQLGQATAGAYLQPVYTNNGYVGFAILLDTGATLPAGTNEVADLIFTTLPVTNATAVNLTFGDYPTGRQIVDNNLNSLPATYQGGTVSLTPAEYAADVYPRTNGDSQVNIFYWLEVGRMVAGLDVPTNTDELLRADCAPRNAPDGVLTVADWVQAGRYALGLDPLTLVTPYASTPLSIVATPLGGPIPSRILQIANASAQRGQTVNVPVQLVCATNENAFGLTIGYNTNLLRLVNVLLGTNVTAGRLNVNSNHVAGKLGIALALSPGTAFAAGTNQVLVLQFVTGTNASGPASLNLENTLVQLQVADNTASSLDTVYVNGTVTLPSAPKLALTNAGSHLQFNWPLADGTFSVQTASQPQGPWTTIVLPLTTNGGNVTVTCNPTNQQQYFRLQGQ